MEKLRFKLDEIPPEGLEFDLATDPSVYVIDQVKVLHPPGVSGRVTIRRDGGELDVTGEVRATVEQPCSRCLKPVSCPVGGEFSFRMVPHRKAPEGEEFELSGGDLDVEFYEGGEVDLRTIVAEQIYLNVPMTAPCRPDCRGLCPVCGQDLNMADCGHRPEAAGDPRWKALADLTKQPKED